jgi:hypothetical protein
MALLGKNWLVSEPHDYELKKYLLLDAIQYIVNMIEDGKIHSALVEVEDRLLELYKFQGEKSTLENKLRVLKGINLDTMSLDYEYPETLGNMEPMYEISDFAIDELEAVHKLIRVSWRKSIDKLSITEIPEKRPTKEHGYVFISKRNSKDNILCYQYTPIVSNTDWKTLDLQKVAEIESGDSSIANYIQSIENSNNFRIWRIDHNLKTDNFEEGLFEIIRYALFYKIVVS